MSLSALDVVVCCVAVVASIATGLIIAIRKGVSESSSQFFLAGRRLGWPVVGASLFATNIGAEHLVGLSGDSYRYGLSAGAVELHFFVATHHLPSLLASPRCPSLFRRRSIPRQPICPPRSGQGSTRRTPKQAAFLRGEVLTRAVA